MSVRICARVWESDLAGSDLLLMLALADHADDEGVCWPSVPKVAVKARMSERTAQRSIARLSAAGLLAVDRAAAPGGANRYTVMPGGPAPAYPQVPAGDNLTPPAGVNLSPVTARCHRRGVTATSPQGCHSCVTRIIKESSGNRQAPAPARFAAAARTARVTSASPRRIAGRAVRSGSGPDDDPALASEVVRQRALRSGLRRCALVEAADCPAAGPVPVAGSNPGLVAVQRSRPDHARVRRVGRR